MKRTLGFEIGGKREIEAIIKIRLAYMTIDKKAFLFGFSGLILQSFISEMTVGI